MAWFYLILLNNFFNLLVRTSGTAFTGYCNCVKTRMLVEMAIFLLLLIGRNVILILDTELMHIQKEYDFECHYCGILLIPTAPTTCDTGSDNDNPPTHLQRALHFSLPHTLPATGYTNSMTDYGYQ